jgi:NAD(P) transhydrogenase subunit alpha
MGVELFLLAADTAQAANGSADSAATQPELPLILGLTVFVLAIFVGFEIITKIPPTLHTPLMSGSNAISGITVVGALIAAGAAGSGQGFWASALGLFAVALATVNVVGGFLVTNRMLEMFRRKK